MIDWTAAAVAGKGLLDVGGGLLGGGEEETEIPWQTKDYYEYGRNISRQTQAKIRNELDKRKYEAFPGARNLRTVVTGGMQAMIEEPPPDYFAALEQGISVSGYSPMETMQKDKSEYTEWDKMAEEHGLIVTKYSDFKSAEDIQQALWEQNWGGVDVSGSEIQIWQGVIFGALDIVAPGVGTFLRDLCGGGPTGGGSCDEFMGDVIRTVKTWMKTGRDMGSDFNPFTSLFY